MSSFIDIAPNESACFVNWETGKFFTLKDKIKNNVIPFSQFIANKILARYNVLLKVIGKYRGKRMVSIYLRCQHGVSFILKIPANNFIENSALRFNVFRRKWQNCTCRKLNL